MGQTIHFVRHGEVYNPEKILYGLQPGWRLSDRGLEMAHAVAEWSKTLNLGAIHSSPPITIPQCKIKLLQPR